MYGNVLFSFKDRLVVDYAAWNEIRELAQGSVIPYLKTKVENVTQRASLDL